MSAIAIFDAKIFTGSKNAPYAQALLAENKRITAVGSVDEIKKQMPEEVTVLHLPGCFITPGLVDAHCHLAGLGQTLQWVDLTGCTSLADCQKQIATAVSGLQPGEWLIGRGWNHLFWEEQKEPVRQDLDAIVPDHPALMIRACGHAIWVNSKALSVCGVSSETPEPTGGQIDREADGHPTGLIRESREVIEDHLPAPSLSRRMATAKAAQDLVLSLGITGIHTCETLADYAALQALEKEGALKLRVNHLLPPEDITEADLQGISPGNGSDHLWHSHVKLFADGSLGAETAFLHAPYETANHCGIACLTTEEMRDHMVNAYRTGRSVAVHAIGDAAVTCALDAMEAARKIIPGPRRDRIEHVQLITDEDIVRMRKMDVTASVQPGFLPTDWKMAEEKWGDRIDRSYAWKTLKENGIRLQFGSDTPVEPMDPRIGIRGAFERCGKDGIPENGWRKEEKLSLEDALSGYFAGASWTGHREEKSGKIAPGNWADLTVFAEDPFAGNTPVTEIPVTMTIIAGEVVYKAAPTPR